MSKFRILLIFSIVILAFAVWAAYHLREGHLHKNSLTDLSPSANCFDEKGAGYSPGAVRVVGMSGRGEMPKMVKCVNGRWVPFHMNH